jgi:hypothetical protein
VRVRWLLAQALARSCPAPCQTRWHLPHALLPPWAERARLAAPSPLSLSPGTLPPFSDRNPEKTRVLGYTVQGACAGCLPPLRPTTTQQASAGRSRGGGDACHEVYSSSRSSSSSTPGVTSCSCCTTSGRHPNQQSHTKPSHLLTARMQEHKTAAAQAAALQQRRLPTWWRGCSTCRRNAGPKLTRKHHTRHGVPILPRRL